MKNQSNINSYNCIPILLPISVVTYFSYLYHLNYRWMALTAVVNPAGKVDCVSLTLMNVRLAHAKMKGNVLMTLMDITVHAHLDIKVCYKSCEQGKKRVMLYGELLKLNQEYKLLQLNSVGAISLHLLIQSNHCVVQWLDVCMLC